jgi:hypothetical protein
VHIKEYFCLQFKKQEILIYILFPYSRIESNILLLYLKDFCSLEKLLFATITKIKTAKNKAIRKIKIVTLLKTKRLQQQKKL